MNYTFVPFFYPKTSLISVAAIDSHYLHSQKNTLTIVPLQQSAFGSFFSLTVSQMYFSKLTEFVVLCLTQN